MKYITCIALIFGFFISSFGQMIPEETGVYLKRTFEKDGISLNYRVLFPEDFDPAVKYPLILFLHGAGERGDDNESQLIHGSQLFLDSLEKYPAVVILPQCPKTDFWANIERTENSDGGFKFNFSSAEEPTKSLSLVMELVDSYLASNYVDKSRFYVTGLSMGGMGTFELMWRIPEKISAALPICGGAATDMAEKMTNIPTWIFHGTEDKIVHPRFSIAMVRAIQKKGGKAKISLYSGVGHNSWDHAFAEENFLSWMFTKSK